METLPAPMPPETTGGGLMALYPGTAPSPDLGPHAHDRAGQRSRPGDGSADHATGELLARAAATLALHQPGHDGWCGGCLQESILTFPPCSRAVWAAEVRRTYGVVDDSLAGPS